MDNFSKVGELGAPLGLLETEGYKLCLRRGTEERNRFVGIHGISEFLSLVRF